MIHIRKAQPQDTQAIAGLMYLAMPEIVALFVGSNDKDQGISFLAHHIASPGNQYALENIIVAVEDNVVLGQICCYDGALLQTLRQPILAKLEKTQREKISLDLETQPGEIYIDTLAVAETARGRGIAKLLLLYVIDLYVKQQHHTLGLLVDKENPMAKSLYIRMGFQLKMTRTVFGKEMDHLQYSII